MHTRNRSVPAAPATLAAVVVGAAPAQAIVGGGPDRGAHPTVGLLAFDSDGPGGLPPIGTCNGSVLSDHASLTARHRIEPPLLDLPPHVQWVVTLEPGTPAHPVEPGGASPARSPPAAR